MERTVILDRWRAIGSLILVSAATTLTTAQNPARLQFEVASVKTIAPNSQTSIGLTVSPGGRVVIPAATLKSLTSTAFAIPPQQIVTSAPWMTTDKYSIEAKPSADMQSLVLDLRHTWTRIESEPLRTMLQNLLIDRFGLTFHREMKTDSVYVMEQNGKPIKLRLVEAAKPNADGSPGAAGSYPSAFGSVGYTGARWVLFQVSMSQLAQFAYNNILYIPVLDRTGLAGAYSYRQAEPDVDPSYTEQVRSFLNMIQDLGLRLRKTDGEVELLVVDSARRPTEN